MWPFKRKTLEDVIFKKIVVHGVLFRIKKLDPLSFLDGSKTMLQSFDVYKVGKQPDESNNSNINKVKEHYRDVFISAVVEPKLSRKDDGTYLFVDNLFTEWDLANDLYIRIIEHTYGKKKLKRSMSLEVAHLI